MPGQRRADGDRDLGQVGRNREQDHAAQGSAEVQALSQDVGVVRQLDPGDPDHDGGDDEDQEKDQRGQRGHVGLRVGGGRASVAVSTLKAGRWGLRSHLCDVQTL